MFLDFGLDVACLRASPGHVGRDEGVFVRLVRGLGEDLNRREGKGNAPGQAIQQVYRPKMRSKVNERHRNPAEGREVDIG